MASHIGSSCTKLRAIFASESLKKNKKKNKKVKPNNFAVEIIVHVKQNLSLNEFYDTGSKKKEKRKKRIVSELSFDDGIRNPPRNGGREGGEDVSFLHKPYASALPLNFLVEPVYYINSRVCFGSAGSWKIWPRISRTCPLPDSTRHLDPLRQSAYQNLAITRPPSFACLFTDPATEQTSFNRGENVCPLVFPHPFPTGRGRPRGKYLVALTQVRNNIFFGIFTAILPNYFSIKIRFRSIISLPFRLKNFIPGRI